MTDPEKRAMVARAKIAAATTQMTIVRGLRTVGVRNFREVQEIEGRIQRAELYLAEAEEILVTLVQRA